MLALFSLIEYKCISPLKVAPPVPNGTLKKLSLVVRHGARTPIFHIPKAKKFTWNCMHPFYYSFNFSILYNIPLFAPSCQPGDLLTSGFEQHIQLAKFYKKAYARYPGFFPETLDPTQIKVHATDVPRAQNSIASFVKTLYPNDTLVIDACGSDMCDLKPPFDTCKELDNDRIEFEKSEKLLSRFNESYKIFSELAKGLDYDLTPDSWNNFIDFIVVHGCNFHDDWFTEEQFERAVSDHSWLMAEFYKTYYGVPGAATMRRLIKDAMDDVRIHLYGCHDTTIMSLLSIFGIDLEKTSPYRSHFTMELWEVAGEEKVRFTFNGQVVTGKVMETEEMSFKEFQKVIAPIIDHC